MTASLATRACFSRVSPAEAAADAIPLLVDDTYHLFHLTTPPFTRHHPVRLRSSWWRLRSRDLVHWTRDPQPCITPGESGPDAPEADGAWTGAAVAGPDGAIHLFYTGYNLTQNGRQVILQAKARGAAPDAHARTGFVCPGSEIAFTGTGRDQLEDVDFRDPYVFYHVGETRYWMVVATRQASGSYWTRGCIALLTSTDPELHTWTFHPQPLYRPNDMFCPECPELFRLPSSGKWYLAYSRFHAPNAGTVYRIADTPYGPWRVPRDGSHGRLDGRRWYAAKSCPKAGDSNRRVYFGWIGDFVEDEGKWLWGGDLAVPREVAAIEGDPQGCLRVVPTPASVALAVETSTAVPASLVPSQITLASSSSGITTIVPLNVAKGAVEDPDVPLDALVTISFSIDTCDAHTFGLILQPDADQRGHRLVLTPSGASTYTVTLLTDLPPLDDFWADQYKRHLPRLVDGPEIVRHDGVVLGPDGVQTFLRGALVEVFMGGRSLSFRLPRAPAPASDSDTVETAVPDSRRRLDWFVEDGEVKLKHVSVRYGGHLDKIA